MEFTIDFQEESSYLSCRISGKWVTEELRNFIDAARAELTRRGQKSIFADMSLVTGPPPEMDRFMTGEYFATAFRGIKVAIVYHKVYANKFFEDTAVNRGALVRVFPDSESALQWLLTE